MARLALVFDFVQLLAERHLLRRELLGVDRGIHVRATECHADVIGQGRGLLVAHIELRHAQYQGGPHRLRVLQKINQPLPLCPAPFIRKVGCQGSTKAIELMAYIAFVAFVDSAELARWMKVLLGCAARPASAFPL